MPKDTSIKKILVIGSGPIVIGQGCEFDYSGTQACKALREEGYEVVLVNSNPATIMTDPETAPRTYIEPITPEFVEKIIIREKPDALLPTLGGQTALNCAMELHRSGVLERENVRMIGANADAIDRGEDRNLFKEAMIRIGLDVPRSGIAHTMEEARQVARDIGTFPLIIRPAFTLGGMGGGVAYNKTEFEEICARGLDLSPVSEILIEESLIGWKEFEMEVMRDRADNCVVICSIENIDPMGVHTGDSITVAPIQTLTDREYQVMRDASFAVIREIGVETGGSNIQFAINPANGRMIVIEMNPRVSRSSALASKATGFPIAKLAAKLAVGYTLDELSNDITRETPACFEPTIDYVVTKVPRFTFEKFKQADEHLTTSMKSVGEAMAIGRTFKESLQKALRSLETGRWGWGFDAKAPQNPSAEEITRKLAVPTAERIFWIQTAFSSGFSLEEVHQLTQIDPWFLAQMRDLAEAGGRLASLDLREAKKLGFSDRQIALARGTTEEAVRQERREQGIIPGYRLVDTCAAEFEAYTPYFYSTYGDENEARDTGRKKILILGGGPNRIGQGIEFDYCCVHASMALREMGYETIIVNSNPETVSTDYDSSDKLFFEPLTLEDVLHICGQEKPDGVIVQFGGQTPLNLANALEAHGVPIIGTSPKAIDLAEDREHFSALLRELGLKQAEAGTATNVEDAAAIAGRIGYPVLLRPSFVLGGRGMIIVYEEKELRQYMSEAVEASEERPVLIDRFLENAVEIDVDVIADRERAVIGAIMQHVEPAGIHSGDSACAIPPVTIAPKHVRTIEEHAAKIARDFQVKGILNVQFAICDDEVYIIEANPRASRTVPIVSKVTGISMARHATEIMLGKKLKDMNLKPQPCRFIGVKEAVFPFNMFPEVDPVLGPEMRATGEVMGIADNFGMAYYKAQEAAGCILPTSGKVLVTVSDRDKKFIEPIARDLISLGFQIVSTGGTAEYLRGQGVETEVVNKLHEGRPNLGDMITNKQIDLIINTPVDRTSMIDDSFIRMQSIQKKIPYMTTIAAARATVEGIRSAQHVKVSPRSLQEYHS